MNRRSQQGTLLDFGDIERAVLECFSSHMSSLLLRNAVGIAKERSKADNMLSSLMMDYLQPHNPKSLSRSNSTLRDGWEFHHFSWRSEFSTSNKFSLQELISFDFDVFKFEHSGLVDLSVQMFESTGLHSSMGISLQNMRGFIEEIEHTYRDNFFHNFRHAFSVFHVAFIFMLRSGANGLLTETEFLTLLVSAIGHGIHATISHSFGL